MARARTVDDNVVKSVRCSDCLASAYGRNSSVNAQALSSLIASHQCVIPCCASTCPATLAAGAGWRHELYGAMLTALATLCESLWTLHLCAEPLQRLHPLPPPLYTSPVQALLEVNITQLSMPVAGLSELLLAVPWHTCTQRVTRPASLTSLPRAAAAYGSNASALHLSQLQL